MRGNLTWFETAEIQGLSILKPEFNVSDSGNTVTLNNCIQSDVTSIAYRDNKLILDHKSKDWYDGYTMHLTIKNQSVIGGDFLNDGKGKKQPVANIDGCFFSNDIELLVMGTYTNLDKSDGALGFILRVQK